MLKQERGMKMKFSIPERAQQNGGAVMYKKILSVFLAFMLGFSPVCAAFAAFKTGVSKTYNIDPSHKLEYVNLDFFEQFEDNYLQNYIIKAVESNHNARAASYKTSEHRENIKVALGAQLPSLSVGANYLGLKTPDFGAASDTIKKNNLTMPFITSWELDLLLKNNDKRKSAKKSYEAALEDERAVYIALAGDVVSLYFNLLNLDKQIELTQDTIQNQKEIYERSKKSHNLGVLTLIELNKQEQNLKNVTILNDELLKSRDTLLAQFRLLISETPDYDVARGKLDNIKLINKIPQEIPSDVIFSRPDVLSAERQLESAGLNIQVARKELLPRFNVTGVLAFNSIVGNFFSWESTLALLLAGATQDLFAGGKKIANLKIKKLQYEQLFERYKHTNINALKEVNDALLIAKYDYKIYNTIVDSNEVEMKNFKMVQNKHTRGAIGKIELLNQQNELINSNKNLANKKTDNLVNLITLYKAAGGKL